VRVILNAFDAKRDRQVKGAAGFQHFGKVLERFDMAIQIKWVHHTGRDRHAPEREEKRVNRSNPEIRAAAAKDRNVGT
jgi:hypothetical protein